MFADLILAGFVAAAGAWDAPVQTPVAQPAVIRSTTERADRHNSGPTLLHLAADLGCPRHYGDYNGDYSRYPRRCRRRHAEPYHEPRPPRYGRGHEDYRAPHRSERYGYRDDRRPAYEDGRYRDPAYRGDPRDRLLDREGRPYSRSPGYEDDRDSPRYRPGAYDPAFDEERYRDDLNARLPRGVRRERSGFDVYDHERRSGAPRLRTDYYHRSSYHGYYRKKKDTMTGTITTTKTRRPAGSDAGSIV